MSNRPLSKPTIVYACLLALVLAEGAAWAAPFACTGEAFVDQGATAQLNTIDQTNSPFVFTPIGSAAGYAVNNLGFRRTDGLLYAWRGDSPNQQVISIDDSGSVTLLGAGGVPAAAGTEYNSGDVSVDGTLMYLSTAGRGSLHTIDLPGLTFVSTVTVTDLGRVLDLAAHPSNGLLYGGDKDGGEVAEIDPTTGTRVDKAVSDVGFGTLPGGGGDSYGAAWFDAEETLFLYRNNGVIFEIAGATTATPSLVGVESGEISLGFNDGAACVQREIGAAKSMSSSNGSLLPSTITIDYVFENFGVSALTDLSAIDDLTAVFGTPGVDWTFTSISSSANIDHNTGYDGDSDPELIDQTVGTEQDLAVAAVATVSVVIELLTHDGDTNMDDLFCNQVVVTGSIGGVEFGDVSTAGSDPDPAPADGIPAEDEPACFPVPVELMAFSVE